MIMYNVLLSLGFKLLKQIDQVNGDLFLDVILQVKFIGDVGLSPVVIPIKEESLKNCWVDESNHNKSTTKVTLGNLPHEIISFFTSGVPYRDK